MKTFYKKYAKLILEKGLAFHRGQYLRIKCEYQQYDFAREVAAVAYELGAAHVTFLITDSELERIKMDNLSIEEYQRVPGFFVPLFAEFEKNDWAFLSIDSTEGKAFLEGCDVNKTAALGKQIRKVTKNFNESLMKNEKPWCVVCVPGPQWAKQVLGEDATTDDLWEVIAPILKLDKNDPSIEWEKETHNFHKHMTFLNDLSIKSLHYKSDTSDLTIGFHKDSYWVGGPSTLPNGDSFYPNLPTSEIFNAPDITQCSGWVTTTKPTSVLGTQTEEVTFTFENGKVIDVDAKKGLEALKSFLDSDPGARQLGEVALVDENSAIAKSNKIFSSILYDENASCHIALGACYPENFKNIDMEEIKAKNGNDSNVHIDFMIGSKSLNIVATTTSGEEVTIMKNGLFAF